MQVEYDFLIVGAGPYGSVCAHELTRAGKRCLVVDKRSHTGGNIYCENVEGINVHTYGPHIFHTNDEEVWKYVNQFVRFNNFINSPIANYKGQLFNLPFNMNTFHQLWGANTPDEAAKMLEKERAPYKHIKDPKNLEEQALVLVGKTIYEKLVKGYSEKQWGRSATEIPASVIKRIPLRFTFDNNYYDHRYQGIPIGGYNVLIDRLLKDVRVILGTDFLENREELGSKAKKIIYTGRIDAYFDFKYGRLDYRSLHFEHEVLHMENFQGVAAVNYTGSDVPFTRIIEHKHFEFGNQPNTVVTREYPRDFEEGIEPHYPINDPHNQLIYNRYAAHAASFPHVLFGGRLAEYKYYDMDQVIKAASKQTRQLLES